MKQYVRTQHSIDLEHLTYQLEDVNESREDIHWIMSEGIWFKPNGLEYHSLCDLILVYNDSAVALEYKTSRKGRPKALKQIQAGKDFILEELKIPYKHGKFVWKVHKGYKFEYMS